MNLHIDLAVLLAIVLFFRLRPSDEPRSSGSVQVTAVLVLVFGLLIAGTNTGQIALDAVKGTVGMLGQIG
jgi:hypothetical protein